MTMEQKMKMILSKKGKKHIPRKERECSYCQKVFLAVHKDKKFCSKRCEWKFGYHFGNSGKTRKIKARENLLAKSMAIGNCQLCGVLYSDIKTLKELGSTMFNSASIFHKDHMTPLSKGGLDIPGNIRYLCWFCNFARKDIDTSHDGAIKNASAAFWDYIHAKTTND